MCFLRSSAVLLVVAAFAAARPVFSGNYNDDDSFGGYLSSSRFGGLTDGYLGGSFGSGSNSQKMRSFVRGYGSGFDNSEDNFNGGNSASNYGFSRNGISDVSGNGFKGVSRNGFKAIGSFSSIPGVVFAFPSLTSVSYSRVPQQNDDLATLAVLCAILADSENSNDNNDAAAVQTVSRQTYADTAVRDSNKQASNVAFVPVVTVPAAAKQQKTTKIVKTTIETDGSVSNIPGLNGDLAEIAAGSNSDSLDANGDASASRSYSQASSSSSATAGASSRLY